MEKFNRACDQEFLNKCRKIYPAFFASHYAIGRQLPAGGIIKSCDLLSGKVLNSDMPWWSLPETIRAAALAIDFTGDESLKEIVTVCAEDFFKGYVRPECHSMAVQTRDAAGNVVAVIPATPDVDPGYHTNLSLIDAIPVIRKMGL